MVTCFGRRDRALGHELLHEAVVDRDLSQPAVAQHVPARVTDVGDRQHLAVECVVDDRDRGDRRTHAGLVGVLQ